MEQEELPKLLLPLMEGHINVDFNNSDIEKLLLYLKEHTDFIAGKETTYRNSGQVGDIYFVRGKAENANGYKLGGRLSGKGRLKHRTLPNPPNGSWYMYQLEDEVRVLILAKSRRSPTGKRKSNDNNALTTTNYEGTSSEENSDSYMANTSGEDTGGTFDSDNNNLPFTFKEPELDNFDLVSMEAELYNMTMDQPRFRYRFPHQIFYMDREEIDIGLQVISNEGVFLRMYGHEEAHGPLKVDQLSESLFQLAPIPISWFQGAEESSKRQKVEDECVIFTIFTERTNLRSNPFLFAPDSFRDSLIPWIKYLSVKTHMEASLADNGSSLWNLCFSLEQCNPVPTLETLFSLPPETLQKWTALSSEFCNKPFSLENMEILFTKLFQAFRSLAEIGIHQGLVHPFITSAEANNIINQRPYCLLLRLSPSNEYKLVFSSWNADKGGLSNYPIEVQWNTGLFSIKLKDETTYTTYSSIPHLLFGQFLPYSILDEKLNLKSFNELFPDFVEPEKADRSGYFSAPPKAQPKPQDQEPRMIFVKHRNDVLGRIKVNSTMTISAFVLEVEKQLDFKINKLSANDVPINPRQYSQAVFDYIQEGEAACVE